MIWIGRLFGLVLLLLSLTLLLARQTPPRHSTLAYWADEGRQHHLYLTPALTQQAHLLTDLNTTLVNPTWSPTGAELAFHCDNKLCLVRWDGSALRPITPWLGIIVEIAWSTDGQHLAFSVGNNYDLRLYTIQRDGSELRRLAADLSNAHSPVWSPDGTSLVVVSDHSGDDDLYRVELNTGQWVALAPHPAADYAPSWSPDRAWIAFESERGGQSDLFLMRPDGSEVQRLSVCGCWGGVWSPDGGRIAAYARQGLQTHVVWLDRAGQLLGRTPPVLVYAGKPVWSPDGTQLAVTIVQEGRNQIAVWDIEQAAYVWSPPHAHPTYHPAWSRPMDLPWRGGWVSLLGGILLLVGVKRGKNR